MIRTLAKLALAGAGFLALATAASALTLKPTVVARGEVVRAGDFFDGLAADAEAPLFRAPSPGSTGIVSADRLVEAVARLGQSWTPPAGLDHVTVRRPSRAGTAELAPDEIADLVAGALADTLPEADSRADVHVTLAPGTAGMPLPGADATAEVAEIVVEPGTRRFRATVAAGAGEARRSAAVEGSFALDLPVPVLAGDVARGDIVTRDVLIHKRLGADAARRFLVSEGDIVGFAARRSLRAGSAIRANDIEPPRIVTRNQLVTIVYAVPGLTLTTQGRALGEAALGDTVSVVNVRSNRVVQAEARGPGQVVVSGPAKIAQR